MQEKIPLTIDFYKKKTESVNSMNSVGSLNQLQKTIYQLLNDVQNQENQIRNSLDDIKQTMNHFEFPKTTHKNEIQESPGPSFRGNFNTASLPYRWWNRSMPCLPLSERHVYLSGSQDSLSESFQVCYFTPKKKKSISNEQNSGYCIWLSHDNTGEEYCFEV